MNDSILDGNLSSDNSYVNYEEKLQRLAFEGYEFKMSDYIRRGFELFKMNIAGFILFLILTLIIGFILSSIPYVGWIASIAVSGPLAAGWFIMARKLSKNESADFANFFDGFKVHFKDLLISYLLVFLFTFVGMFLLLIPGIYLAVSYLFVTPVVLFSKSDFWQAMELSRKFVTKKWFTIFGFAIVIILINVLGALALGIGLLVTIPATTLAIYAAYEDIVGVE